MPPISPAAVFALALVLSACGNGDTPVAGTLPQGPPTFREDTTQGSAEGNRGTLELRGARTVELIWIQPDGGTEVIERMDAIPGQVLGVWWDAASPELEPGRAPPAPSAAEQEGRTEPLRAATRFGFERSGAHLREAIGWVRPGRGRFLVDLLEAPILPETIDSGDTVELVSLALVDAEGVDARIRRIDGRARVVGLDEARGDSARLWRVGMRILDP